jgi:hypothetical protein
MSSGLSSVLVTQHPYTLYCFCTVLVLCLQYHSGVANAAPATAPYTPFGEMPPVRAAGAEQQEAAAEGAAAAGGGAVLGVTDALCELKFRVSPTAFYQVGASAFFLKVTGWAHPPPAGHTQTAWQSLTAGGRRQSLTDEGRLTHPIPALFLWLSSGGGVALLIMCSYPHVIS